MKGSRYQTSEEELGLRLANQDPESERQIEGIVQKAVLNCISLANKVGEPRG